MNFGYAYDLGEKSSISLKPEDQADCYSWQIYEHMLRQSPLGSEDCVLEIGSGRGGACFFISQYYIPRMVTGLDLSDKAIEFCKNTYQAPNLEFIVGSAAHLPIEDGSIDVVINVESSHAYPDFNGFVTEVSRVLKPGGYLMTADNRKTALVDVWRSGLIQSGLMLKLETDITNNVVMSLNLQEDTKAGLIADHVPNYFKGHFKEFAGMRGSHMFKDFVSGSRTYKSFILQKPI